MARKGKTSVTIINGVVTLKSSGKGSSIRGLKINGQTVIDDEGNLLTKEVKMTTNKIYNFMMILALGTVLALAVGFLLVVL